MVTCGMYGEAHTDKHLLIRQLKKRWAPVRAEKRGFPQLSGIKSKRMELKPDNGCERMIISNIEIC